MLKLLSVRRWLLLCSLLALPAAAEDLNELRALLARGGLPEVQLRLKNLLLADPGDAGARLLMAEVLLGLRDGAAAEQEVQRALDAGLERRDALVPLGEALVVQGEGQRIIDEVTVPEGASPALEAALQVVRGKGFELIDDIGGATLAYERALSLDPSNVGAYLGQARIGFAMDDPERGRAAIDQALAVDSNSVPALEMLGEVLYRDGDRAAAEAAFSKVLDRNPSAWTACYKRAVMRLDRGDLPGAEEDLRCMDRLNRDFAGGKLVRGRLSLARGELPEAALHLELYANAFPADLQGHYLAALAMTALGRREAANAFLERYLAVAPKSVDALLPAARLLLDNGEAERAEALLTGLGDSPEERAAVDVQMVQVLAQQGRLDQAWALAQANRSRDPNNPALQRTLVRLAARRGDWTQTAALSAELTQSDAASSVDRLLLVNALIRQQRNDEALAVAEDLVQRAGDDARAQYALGAALLAAGKTQRAKQAWGEALRIDPQQQRAAIALARLDTAVGDTDAARQVLSELDAAGPGNAQAVLELADMDLADGDPVQAAARLRNAVEANPDDAALRLRLARVLATNGQPQTALATLPTLADGAPQPALLRMRALLEMQTEQVENAAASLERLLELAPEDVTSRYRLVQAYALLGRYDALSPELVRALEEAPSSPLVQPTLALVMNAVPNAEVRDRLQAALQDAVPDQPAVQYQAALSARRDGDATTALRHMRAAKRAAPDWAPATAGLLGLLLETGANQQADSIAKDWFAAHPDDVLIRLSYAGSLLQAGRTSSAIEQYRAILSAAPETPEALNNLAVLTSETAPSEALALSRKAVEMVPDEPSYADTLGNLLLQLGRVDEARSMLADARKRFPNNPSIGYRYAAALAAAGARQEARRLLLELEGRAFPERTAASSLLEQLTD
jgi:putative PEP-CTERM system TPR-repeat lipoprotein